MLRVHTIMIGGGEMVGDPLIDGNDGDDGVSDFARVIVYSGNDN